MRVLRAGGRFLEIGKREIWTTDDVARIRPNAQYHIVDLAARLHADPVSVAPILRDALGLADHQNVNPSGGPLAANPIMVAGLTRIGEVAQRIMDGSADRGLAHATSGPCLQQNLVCVLEGDGQ